MIWLTWRQYRSAVLYTLIALAALAAVMIPTGLAMHHAFDSLGLGSCTAGPGGAQLVSQAAGMNCATLSVEFTGRYGAMTLVGVLFEALPALAGLFFGAPLVSRELEHGTHRLVWTQGVTRRHWILVRFGLVGAGTLVLSAVYGLGVSWWEGPLAAVAGGRLSGVFFNVQGVVPIGYTLFAVALGMFAGCVWRRTVPAMGTAVGGFIVVRALVEALARPHYMVPATLTYPVRSSLVTNPMSGDWVYDSGMINAAGKLIDNGSQAHCSGAVAGGQAAQGGGGLIPEAHTCVGQVKGGEVVADWMRYQPADRFWAFQGIETGIFLVLAALLVFLAVRRLGRLS
jgi:hypothetical protein